MGDAVKEQESPCELVIFQCKLLYVYKIPPPSSIGHRAELWDVEKPEQEVSMKVVVMGESCTIRLLDAEKGELFAECPIPKPEDRPLHTALDSVIDSSRFFVLRLEDKQSKRHAFIGIGFLNRKDASDFSAAIAEHLQSLRRLKDAERMREEFLANQAREDTEELPSVPFSDLSLQHGQVLNLNLKKKQSSSKWGNLKTAKDPGMPGDGLVKLPMPIAQGPTTEALSVSDQKDDWGDFVS